MGFNRTFMELKDDFLGGNMHGVQRFNRTFMELKASEEGGLAHDERFNRTFMELKGPEGSATCNGPPFQSHLYGIERTIQNVHNIPGLVSIAPLWN